MDPVMQNYLLSAGASAGTANAAASNNPFSISPFANPRGTSTNDSNDNFQEQNNVPMGNNSLDYQAPALDYQTLMRSYLLQQQQQQQQQQSQAASLQQAAAVYGNTNNFLQQQQQQQQQQFNQNQAAAMQAAAAWSGNPTSMALLGATTDPLSSGGAYGGLAGLMNLEQQKRNPTLTSDYMDANRMLLQSLQDGKQQQQFQQLSAGGSTGGNGNNPDTYSDNGILGPWSETSAGLLGKMAVHTLKEGKKSRKKPKDKPKRPLSAYNIFFKEERHRILDTIPKNDEEKEKSSGDKEKKDEEKEKSDEKEEKSDEEKEKTNTEKEKSDEEKGDEEKGDKEKGDEEKGDKEKGDEEKGDEEKGDEEKEKAKDENVDGNNDKDAADGKNSRKRKKRPHGKIGFENLAKMIGQRWQNLDAEKVGYYKKKAEEDMKRYKDQMEEYLAKQNETKKQMEKLVDNDFNSDFHGVNNAAKRMKFLQ